MSNIIVGSFKIFELLVGKSVICVFCLQFFRSVQSTCTDLLKVIEKYQQRIIRESKTSLQELFVIQFLSYFCFAARSKNELFKKVKEET